MQDAPVSVQKASGTSVLDHYSPETSDLIVCFPVAFLHISLAIKSTSSVVRDVIVYQERSRIR